MLSLGRACRSRGRDAESRITQLLTTCCVPGTSENTTHSFKPHDGPHSRSDYRRTFQLGKLRPAAVLPVEQVKSTRCPVRFDLHDE